MSDLFTAGQQLPQQRFTVTRADLVRYAGAAGDFNPIHYSDRIAKGAGLPGVVAHGMYTMALAGRALGVWLNDSSAIVEYGVRFTKPVVVPDDDTGVEVLVDGLVKSVDDGGDGAAITLTVTSEGQKVLGQARATVKMRRSHVGGN